MGRDDDLCVCGHTRARHKGQGTPEDIWCEGFEQTTLPYAIEPVQIDRNLWRVVGPTVVKGACSKKTAQEIADELNTEIASV